jgi:hypothetical protein
MAAAELDSDVEAHAYSGLGMCGGGGNAWGIGRRERGGIYRLLILLDNSYTDYCSSAETRKQVVKLGNPNYALNKKPQQG